MPGRCQNLPRELRQICGRRFEIENSAGMSTDPDTIRSYDAVAAEGAVMPEWAATEIDAFVTDLGGSGRVLEIGSGGGEMHY